MSPADTGPRSIARNQAGTVLANHASKSHVRYQVPDVFKGGLSRASS